MGWKEVLTMDGPEHWELRTNSCVVTVHRIPACKTRWFVSCCELRYGACELISEDLDEAKAEAVTMVRDRLERMAYDLEEY